MKDIILNVCKELEDKYTKSHANSTKTISVSHEINEGMNLTSLTQAIKDFAKEENVDVEDIRLYTGVECDDSDLYQNSSLVLSYNKEVPMSEEEIKNKIKKTFDVNLFSKVAKELQNVGYKRIPFDPTYVKEFSGKFSKYQSYKEDQDKLIKYFSLMFKKEE